MREEERVCVVLYREGEEGVRYGVLKRVRNWEGWELPKGHKEGTGEETARMEIGEETGIEVESIEPLDHVMEWEYEDGEKVHVTCECFLARAPPGARIDVSANPHEEHETGYFLNFRDARDVLEYDNQKELLEIARERIEEKE